MPHLVAALFAGSLVRTRCRFSGWWKTCFRHFVMPTIPLIQPRQTTDFIGSSTAWVFPTADFGRPSRQGNSKAQNSSPCTPSPGRRQENGAKAGCSIELVCHVPDMVVNVAQSCKFKRPPTEAALVHRLFALL
jgi:hypothetical protein